MPSGKVVLVSHVVRASVRMRELAALHADLAKRLDELEEKTEGLALPHDTFSRNTRAQLKQVFDALRALMAPPDPPPSGLSGSYAGGNNGIGRLTRAAADVRSRVLPSTKSSSPCLHA